MDIPSLVDFVNENALRISELIAEEISLINPEHRMSAENRLYALPMFCRAAILDLETRAGSGRIQ